MPQMIVRNIPKDVHQRLKELAAKNGVNAEEQVRRLISQAVGTDKAQSFGEVFDALREEISERFEEGDIRELRGRIEQVDLP